MGKTTAALLALAALLVVLLPGRAGAAINDGNIAVLSEPLKTSTAPPADLTSTITPEVTESPVDEPSPAADVLATDVDAAAVASPADVPPADAASASAPVQVAVASIAAPVPMDPPAQPPAQPPVQPMTTTESEHVIATPEAAVLAPAVHIEAGDRLDVLAEHVARSATLPRSAFLEAPRGSLAATGASTDDLLVIGIGLVGVGVILRRLAGRSP
jgi:hypothetical protein